MDTRAPNPPARSLAPNLCGLVAIALLACFWLGTLRDSSPAAVGASSSLDARLRRLFEANAPGVRTIAVPMNGLLFACGERRGAGTVIESRSDRDGARLFYTLELPFELVDELPDRYQSNVAALRERLAALHAAGTARVLLVPVPTKLSIALASDPSLRLRLPDPPGPHDLERTRLIASDGVRAGEPPMDGRRTTLVYRRFAQALGREPGVDVVGLQQLFLTRARAGDVLYAHEDTHWTSLGMNLAVGEVVRVWSGRGLRPPVKRGLLPDAPGDLQRLLALPDHPWFRAHPQLEDVYEPRRLRPPAECRNPLMLVGTSYSNHRGQSLAGLISRASGCPVADHSQSGQGPVAVLDQMLKDPAQLQGAVVVWEFPVRHLMEPFAFAGNP